LRRFSLFFSANSAAVDLGISADSLRGIHDAHSLAVLAVLVVIRASSDARCYLGVLNLGLCGGFHGFREKPGRLPVPLFAEGSEEDSTPGVGVSRIMRCRWERLRRGVGRHANTARTHARPVNKAQRMSEITAGPPYREHAAQTPRGRFGPNRSQSGQAPQQRLRA
jgi:hypothetical protein